MNFFCPVDIFIQIIASPGTPMLGQSYSLICNVTGAENLDSSITYQWTQTQVPNGADTKILSFSTLRFSDAGEYACQVTVGSPYLSGDITMTDTHDVRIQSKFDCILCMHSCQRVRCIMHSFSIGYLVSRAYSMWFIGLCA